MTVMTVCFLNSFTTISGAKFFDFEFVFMVGPSFWDVSIENEAGTRPLRISAPSASAWRLTDKRIIKRTLYFMTKLIGSKADYFSLVHMDRALRASVHHEIN